MNSTATGLSIVLLAGAIGSATLLPMKFVSHWRWENAWLVFALIAYFLLPVSIAAATVPNLINVYSQASTATLLQVAIFGLGWGVSTVMLGLAVAVVGLAVANAIVLGCSIALGSLVPLGMHHPDILVTTYGLSIVAANTLLLGGVTLCALAAYWRDSPPTSVELSTRVRGVGLLICFLAGLLNPLLNFALAAGGQINELARSQGAAEYEAINAVWALAVGMGSIPSILYCSSLLSMNHNWTKFREPASLRNGALCALMGTLFIVSTIGYGLGALRMGALGPAIGWPVYVSSLLVGNAFWGWLTGELRSTSRQSVTAMVAGILVQVVAILLLFLVAPRSDP